MPKDVAGVTGDTASGTSSADDEPEAGSRRSDIFAFTVISLGVLALLVLWLFDAGMIDFAAWWSSLGPWWSDDAWPWLSNWLTSPGFGGLAAVSAAGVALAGARHQARLNAWWQRVEWALDLYVKPDAKDLERRAGAAAIEALLDSRLAKKDEQAFLVEVVKAVTLDPLGDGLEEDDWSAGKAVGENADPDSAPDVDKDRQLRGDDELVVLLGKVGRVCRRHVLVRCPILKARRNDEKHEEPDQNGGAS